MSSGFCSRSNRTVEKLLERVDVTHNSFFKSSPPTPPLPTSSPWSMKREPHSFMFPNYIWAPWYNHFNVRHSAALPSSDTKTHAVFFPGVSCWFRNENHNRAITCIKYFYLKTTDFHNFITAQFRGIPLDTVYSCKADKWTFKLRIRRLEQEKKILHRVVQLWMNQVI